MEILLVVHHILEEQLDSQLSILEKDFPSLKLHIQRIDEADVIFAQGVGAIGFVYAWKQKIKLCSITFGPKDLIKDYFRLS